MPQTCRHSNADAFTLVELLVVVAILSLLVSILVPALAGARRTARAAVCMSALSGIGKGLVMYENENHGFVVPSYNMTGTIGGADVPLDGWACILDAAGLLPANRTASGNIFYCPETVDVEGLKDGQTGADPNNPKGWMDWPNLRLGTACQPVTIPERGFNRILRVAYWINADNPIGGATAVTPDVYYTSSVGYGPGTNGLVMRPTQSSAFSAAARLVTVSDGVYAGRQRDNRLGTTNSRIGYRHPGRTAVANAAFADGHVGGLEGDAFPRGLGGSATLEMLRAENAGPATVFANPDKTLGM